MPACYRPVRLRTRLIPPMGVSTPPWIIVLPHFKRSPLNLAKCGTPPESWGSKLCQAYCEKLISDCSKGTLKDDSQPTFMQHFSKFEFFACLSKFNHGKLQKDISNWEAIVRTFCVQSVCRRFVEGSSYVIQTSKSKFKLSQIANAFEDCSTNWNTTNKTPIRQW